MMNVIRRLFGPKKPLIFKPIWNETIDGSGGRFKEILVSKEPDWKIFHHVAAVLLQRLEGEYTVQLTGIDEAYWDLLVGSDTIVLHFQGCLGTMIHPAGLSNATEGEMRLLERAFDVLAKESAA